MLRLPPAIQIDIPKLKPIRCKGRSCDFPLIGFAQDDKLLLSDSRPGQRVSITGEDLSFTGGNRRQHAKALRFLAARKEDRMVTLLIDNPNFVDSRVSQDYGLHFVLGHTKKTAGRGISITCEGCKTRRTIRGMDLMISTTLVEILFDRMNFNG